MKVENILDAIGAINDEAVQDARVYKPSRYSKAAKRGAIAACFGLIITAAILTLPDILRKLGGSPNVPGGVDAVIESMAVYPATEDIRDVEDATIKNIDKTTAYEITGLGNYLPTALPAGYHFDRASLYETTMKSGTKYHLLRVTYTTGSDEITMAPTNDDGGVPASDPTLFGSVLVIFIMDYEPGTNRAVYSFENLQEYLKTKDDNETFYFSYEDVYIGFSPNDLSTEEFIDVVNSIP